MICQLSVFMICQLGVGCIPYKKTWVVLSISVCSYYGLRVCS